MKISMKPRISPKIRVKWQRIVDLIIKKMDVTAAFIMKVDDDWMSVIVSSKVENTPYVSGHQFFLKNCFGEELIENSDYLLVEDSSKNTRWDESTAIKAGFNYFQGYPLYWNDGTLYGTISVLDKNNNINATAQKDLLEEFKFDVEQDLLLLEKEVDPNLSKLIRGLRAESYQSHKAVFENDFMNSKWIEFMPKGHVMLKNVMFAPLNIEGRTVGIMGLANKEEDFTQFDSTVAEAFGDLCAVALSNSRRFDEINETNEKLESFNRSLVERELRIIEMK